MLLGVEGGGLFSSSASGYSKGLALLLLGQSSDDTSMKSDPQLQLASTKNHLSRGGASFVCFGRASAGLDTPSHLKVGPAHQHDVIPRSLVSNKGNDSSSHVDDDNRKVTLKSSLKKPQHNKPAPVDAISEHEATGGKGTDAPQTEKRKVQWTDDCGSELVKIREFEPSEAESFDEFDNANNRNCSCAVM
ncbi:hypothetical protein Lalb_Chr19g0130101 [Lupinus albus]|uniref:Uncharacterized protein n=1 Tax=Lupinus albus TaxID=3870 RepID=A0A6A4NFR0_LUPAL|nr:hypothetical protein Lalb_Chr19g0130101 [Lupinus albus]